MISELPNIFSHVDTLSHWLSAASTIIAAASGIAALTPTPKDEQFLGKVYRVIDVLALNVGHAKRKLQSKAADESGLRSTERGR